MIEDQLTRDERIRLEAVAQATAATMGRAPSALNIIRFAVELERFIREGDA